METVVEMLKGFSTLSLVIYLVIVGAGWLNGDLMTFQWVMLLAIIFLWIMVRTLENRTEEVSYDE